MMARGCAPCRLFAGLWPAREQALLGLNLACPGVRARGLQIIGTGHSPAPSGLHCYRLQQLPHRVVWRQIFGFGVEI
jgi:hypothetical protein